MHLQYQQFFGQLRWGLARDSQTRNQQKMRHLPITENLKIHATKNKRGQRYKMFLI